MKRIALLLLLAFAALRAEGASFSMPLVDVAPNEAGVGGLYAIWSASDGYVTPTTTIGIMFPPDVTVPSGLNPATCECVFLKHTSTSAGAWAALEVTFTAGSKSGNTIYLGLPQALHKGKFYVRFDLDAAGLVNPTQPGLATLAIIDPDGNTTLSRGFYIRATYTAQISLGAVTGTVKTSAGAAVAGALVMATTTGAYLPTDLSPRKGWVAPAGTTSSAYTTATGSDGSYTLSLAPGTYSMMAQAQSHYKGLAYTVTSTAASVTVGNAATVNQNFSVGALP